ncbi:hypothetical protein NEF87_001371 [Candidatus Lokiarchaeum ossiferum]|uniref:Uncharacterized protein n=1 Tax=Candidatus Lokiarchaeum ossiferum TaxID=2951803 RepID=A0ABY6HNJ3_9ARCH|nr:hypothetical protein NEF87_001371 [Candidatus Lokiarchaeum sp. B-35]
MEKDLPFLKIQIVTTTDTTRSKFDILEEFRKDLENTYGISVNLNETIDGHSLTIQFSSKNLYLTAYERDMSIYTCILENVNSGYLDLEDYFKEATLIQKPKQENSFAFDKNYIVLKYTSNWKDPMRRNYQLTTRVDKLFGIQSAIEEVEDGFLKFYRRREDFEDSKLDNLSRKGWEKWFQLKGISLNSRFALQFFEIVEKRKLLKD